MGLYQALSSRPSAADHPRPCSRQRAWANGQNDGIHEAGLQESGNDIGTAFYHQALYASFVQQLHGGIGDACCESPPGVVNGQNLEIAIW